MNWMPSVPNGELSVHLNCATGIKPASLVAVGSCLLWLPMLTMWSFWFPQVWQWESWWQGGPENHAWASQPVGWLPAQYASEGMNGSLLFFSNPPHTQTHTHLEFINTCPGCMWGDPMVYLYSLISSCQVIAATNRVDILDPALLRSGRLDRKIEFPMPNEEARARIMQIHSRKMNVRYGGTIPPYSPLLYNMVKLIYINLMWSTWPLA